MQQQLQSRHTSTDSQALIYAFTKVVAMAEDSNKENITNGLFPSVSSMAAPEPRKTKKSRSLSMGPGAAVQQLKSDTDNRRKVCCNGFPLDAYANSELQSMMPSVKSILSTAKDGKADEAAKRKAARRKSLANRRVSFAPEATLHTWDVVEYMRDATSSSASSEEARRASSVSQVEPQTPTQTLESDSEVTSPVPQSLGTMEDVLRTTDQSQQDKRKGSLGIPLASPDFESSDEEDDMGDATMDLDDEAEQNPANFRDSTSSSAKLDDALRQASVVAQANTQNFVIEDEGDQTMDMAGDEVTSAFRPFFNKNRRGSVGVRKAIPIENQENENPFKPTRDLPLENEPLSDNDSNEDATMDVTVAFGGIIKQQPATINQSELTKTSKRRRSSTNLGVESSGSPAARPVPRRSLARRRSSMEPSVMEDETMDFTIAVGGIKQVSRDTEEQDLTEASLMDQTMDFTVAVGKIRHMPQPVQPRDATENMFNTERLEDLSMELTANLGKTIAEAINNVAPSPSETQTSKSILPSVTVERHATPTKRSPATPRSATFHSLERRQSTRKSPRRNLHASLSFETPVTPEALSFPSPAVVPKIESPPRAASTPSKNTVTLPVPEQNPTAKSSISDTLRLLLTPRKEILPTPVIASQATPRRTPRRGTTPKKRAAEEERYVSPKKRVRLEVEEESPVPEPKSNMRDDQEGDPISLPDFLNMTGIRFMDLTTTKRRATGYPGADGMMFNTRDNTIEELEPSMDNKIAAAVSTVPMMSMYQHVSQSSSKPTLGYILMHCSHVKK
jgi:kinetochore protein Spc7/SPC105